MLLDVPKKRFALSTHFPVVRRAALTADAIAVTVMALVTTVVAWNRLQFDSWLARYDILTFYLPWYAHLGERLRTFDVPGWNPHLFSGTPFAADPQSGWMYLPAMLTFPLWGPLTAYKAMVVMQLVVTAGTMYAFGRVLGFGALAALTSSIVLLTGPFLQWNTDCCAVMGQFVTWVPLTLLGVELALRASTWKERLVPWSLAALGLSQIFSGWVGEGWLDGGLLVGSYLVYRVLISPSGSGTAWSDRVRDGAATGAAVFGFGFTLGAAGILPRLAINAETNLSGGDYERLSVPSVDNLPWTLSHLIGQILGSGYDRRATTFGGLTVVLTLLAVPLARRRYAVPYFALLTTVCLILTLDTTPLHALFYLIPRFRVIHEHDPWRIMAVAVIGPAMLAGATVESLQRVSIPRRLTPLLLLPLALISLVAATLPESERFLGWSPLIAASLATAIMLLIVFLPTGFRRHGRALGLALLVGVALVQPLGTELTGSWFGWPGDARWERRWRPEPQVMEALLREVQTTDSGGAGAFLTQELASSGPFRFVGYAGVGYPANNPRLNSYMSVRLQSNIQAILTNGRPMFLGLYDMQGYNPIQLARYVDLIDAINGATQDYHTAYLLESGAQSRLLPLLDVRYLLLDASLSSGRPDVQALTANRREVFRTDRVRVYEMETSRAHAWIVHDVREVREGEALSLVADGTIDPLEVALVEGTPPPVVRAAENGDESAVVTDDRADQMTIEVTANAPGMLVVSEIYASGWHAYVNGKRVRMYAADHVLRGIAVEAGTSTVTMRYEPRSLQVGLWLSAISLLAMFGGFGARLAIRCGFARPRRSRSRSD